MEKLIPLKIKELLENEKILGGVKGYFSHFRGNNPDTYFTVWDKFGDVICVCEYVNSKWRLKDEK